MASINTPFHRCVHCSREFNRLEHLVRHERTHTKEKPYRCRLCPQAFSRRDLLRRHELKAHAGHREPYKPGSDGSPPQANSSSQQPTETSPPGVQDSSAHASHDEFPSLPAFTDSSTQAIGNLQTEVIDPALWALHSQDQQHSSTSDSFMDLSATNGFSVQDYLLPDTLHWLEALDQADAAHPLHTLDPQTPRSSEVLRQTVHTTQPPPSNVHLFSLPATPRASPTPHANSEAVREGANSRRAVSELAWERLRSEVEKIEPDFTVPSSDELSQFINRFFSSFHRHQPLLHEATWSPNDVPVWLVLAVCANGALYSLERPIALRLHNLAIRLLPSHEYGEHALQAMMMLSAFSSWSGDPEDLDIALKFHSQMTSALRRAWAAVEDQSLQESSKWGKWKRLESLRRVTYCIFTLMTLMTVSYDIPSSFLLEARHGLPAPEDQWHAASEEQWIQASQQSTRQTLSSAGMVIDQLADPTAPIPRNIETFGAHIVMSLILQRIINFRKSCSPATPGHDEMCRHFLMILKRWQAMWEQEPESSLSPDNPRGPMLFNCTALLRVAYVRLVSDYSDVRRCFGLYSEEQIAYRAQEIPLPTRSIEATKAAIQTCLALQIPTKLGFKIIARTSFWTWSVQHAISYFEAALFLSKWLQKVTDAEHLSAEEKAVLRLVHQILGPVQGHSGKHQNYPLHVRSLLRWAELLDTETTTVWKIISTMAQVLRIYAQILLGE